MSGELVRFLSALEAHVRGESDQINAFVETVIANSDPTALLELVFQGLDSAETSEVANPLLATAQGIFRRYATSMTPEFRRKTANLLLDRMDKFVAIGASKLVYEALSMLCDDEMMETLWEDPRASEIVVEVLLAFLKEETVCKVATKSDKLHQILHTSLYENGELENSNPRFEQLCRGILLLARFFSLFGRSGYEEECQLMLRFAEKSAELTDMNFSLFWTVMNFLFEAMKRDAEFALPFVDIVLVLCEKDLVPESEIKCMNAVCWALGEYDRPVVHSICSLCTRIAIEYLEKTSLLPIEFLTLYDALHETFEYANVYAFVRRQIVWCLEKGSLPVALLLMRAMVENVPEQCYSDMSEMTRDMLRASLTGNNPREAEAALLLVQSFSGIITKDLSNSNELGTLVIPHLQNDDRDVRDAAICALSTLLKMGHIPIQGIANVILKILVAGHENEAEKLLVLLGVAISREMIMSDEKANIWANVCRKIMSHEKPWIAAAAVFVAVSLLEVNEAVRQPLLPDIIVTIDSLVANGELGDLQVILSGTVRLVRVWKEGVRLAHRFLPRLVTVKDLPDPGSYLLKQSVANDVGKLIRCGVLPVVEDVERLIIDARRWTESDVICDIVVGLKVTQGMIRQVPSALQMEFFGLMLKICNETNNVAMCAAAVDAIRTSMKSTRGQETHETMVGLCNELCEKYIQGDLHCLGFIPLQSTDINFLLLEEFFKLVRSLFTVHNDLVRAFVSLACSVFAVDNGLRFNVASSVWYSALRKGVLDEDEMSFIRRQIDEMVVPDATPDVLPPVCRMMIAIADKNAAPADWLHSKLPILVRWAATCANHDRASHCVSCVLWRIVMYNDVGDVCRDLFMDSFKDFPPTDFRVTQKMATMVLEFMTRGVSDPAIARRGLGCLVKILVMSPLERERRYISGDVHEAAKRIVKAACEADAQIAASVKAHMPADSEL